MDFFSSQPSVASPDPARHLHSDTDPESILLPSHSHSDDLEALNLQQEEITEAKTKAGVVIQHRAWTENEPLRSDDIYNPETPSKCAGPLLPADEVLNFTAQSPEVRLLPKMSFSSSPIFYPPSSSPPKLNHKRRLPQSTNSDGPKKKKLFRSFADDINPDPATATPTVNTAAAADARLEDDVAPLQISTKDDGDSRGEIHQPRHEGAPAQSRTGCSSLPAIPHSNERESSAPSRSMKTSTGQDLMIPLRAKATARSYEQIIAQRSKVEEGRAKTAYYGIEIHRLLEDAAHQATIDEAAAQIRKQEEGNPPITEHKSREIKKPTTSTTQHQMWTEKYRARKFTDLVGDERTHRSVLRWLKAWDPIVFPGSVKRQSKKTNSEGNVPEQEKHRKILLLTGPPGLGKTTLAHVCAKQAGYEVLEINASDDRSRDVVKGRIKDALGTETVRGVKEHGKERKAGRPVCVVVDEVDGVVSGSSGSGGEGGFMKALIDLVCLDQKNAIPQPGGNRNRSKDNGFRFLRPLILVCNDVYVPALRPLRTSSMAEIVHVRQPPLDKVISRLKHVFERENIPCDADAVRRLCESTWGLSSWKQSGGNRQGAGEGDIRSVLVQGEWVARKLRATTKSAKLRLTKHWLNSNILSAAAQSQSADRGLGRGGTKEVVNRVFLEGAGLPKIPTTIAADDARLMAESTSKQLGVADLRKRAAINSIRDMADTCGDHDRLMTDCFITYPSQVIQDDSYLSKPNAAYDWLFFHDRLSSRIFGGQEWELNPYLSTGVCGFHDLFAGLSSTGKAWDSLNPKDDEDPNDHPFSGSKADFAAFEAEKQKRATLTEMQSSFAAPLLRLFRSPESIAMELIPSLAGMLAPDVKPVLVGGSGGFGSVASVRKQSERICVQNSVRVMAGLNISFEKIRAEPIDTLATFHVSKPTGGGGSSTGTAAVAPVRYAVRQVLDQEHRKEKLLRASNARQARSGKLYGAPPSASFPSLTSAVDHDGEDKENTRPAGAAAPSRRPLTGKLPLSSNGSGGGGVVKKDFFGRVIANDARGRQYPPHPLLPSGSTDANTRHSRQGSWSSFSSATRKTGAGAGAGSGHGPGNADGRADGDGPPPTTTTTNTITTSTHETRVWVSFNEGYSNAVRKPITLTEFLDSF